MPHSRTEQIFFATGLAAILGLAVALIPAWRNYHSSSAPSLGSTHTGTAAPAQETSYRPPDGASQKARIAAPAAAAKQTLAPRSAAVPAAVKLRLAAVRGDCWVEVRSSSAGGKIRYVGTLAKGKSLEFDAARLWIRFGAPEKVELAVNGKPAVIPSGTLDLLVTSNGVRAAPA
jgi:hypothetical protein